MNRCPTQAMLRSLIAPRKGACMSIYMPTHRAGRDVAQGPIRLKNLLREAESQLVDRHGDNRSMLGVVEPARLLLDDTQFWRHQSDGLAIFSGMGEFDTFRLPASFSEVTKVGDRFYLKPLLAYLSRDMPFYVLRLSLDAIPTPGGNQESAGDRGLSRVAGGHRRGGALR